MAEESMDQIESMSIPLNYHGINKKFADNHGILGLVMYGFW